MTNVSKLEESLVEADDKIDDLESEIKLLETRIEELEESK